MIENEPETGLGKRASLPQTKSCNNVSTLLVLLAKLVGKQSS
jgi:hypothetical protein